MPATGVASPARRAGPTYAKRLAKQTPSGTRRARFAAGQKGSPSVKLIVAIIQPTKLNAVREALDKVEVLRMTICDAHGFGRQRGRTEMYRGHEYTTMLLRKVVVEVVVNEDFLERTLEAIIHVARTGPEGAIGDGKIFVLPAEESIQLSDGARGPGAV